MTIGADLRDSATRVLRRLNLRTLLIAHAVGLVWFVLPLIWTMQRTDWPATFFFSVTVITELSVLFMLAAILIADEVVRRGAWPSVAYPAALVAAAIGTAVSQWYVRAWFAFETFVNRPSVDPVRQLGQMLNLFIEVIIYGGVVMLIYVNRRRDIELMRQAQEVELARANSEQALMQARLATALAEVNPAELLARLRAIHELLVLGSPAADRALEEFTRELRAQLGRDGAADRALERAAT